MKKLFLCFTLLCCSCATQQTFFGGKVVSDYKLRFEGKLECAFVSGWTQDPQCMCRLTDLAFSPDKSFIATLSVMCENP